MRTKWIHHSKKKTLTKNKSHTKHLKGASYRFLNKYTYEGGLQTTPFSDSVALLESKLAGYVTPIGNLIPGKSAFDSAMHHLVAWLAVELTTPNVSTFVGFYEGSTWGVAAFTPHTPGLLYAMCYVSGNETYPGSMVNFMGDPVSSYTWNVYLEFSKV